MSAQQTTEQLDEAEAKAELIAEFNRLVDDVENTATEPLFRLGDWLVEHVPKEQGRRSDLGTIVPKLTLKDLADQRGPGVRWLRDIRNVAEATRGSRMPDIKLTVYRDVLREYGGDLEQANREIHQRKVDGEPLNIPRERPAGEPRFNRHGIEPSPDDDPDVATEPPRARLRRAVDAIATQLQVIRNVLAQLPDDEPSSGLQDDEDPGDDESDAEWSE